jgi:hypothetical protein
MEEGNGQVEAGAQNGLSVDALKIAHRCNPVATIRMLANTVAEANTPAGLAQARAMIDALGVHPMVVAVAAQDLDVAWLLDLPVEATKRLREVDTKVTNDGLLMVDDALNLQGINDTEVPGVAEVTGSLLLMETRGLVLPDLVRAWAVDAGRSVDLSLPVLRVISSHLQAEACQSMALPSLEQVHWWRNIGGGAFTLETYAALLPALEPRVKDLEKREADRQAQIDAAIIRVNEEYWRLSAEAEDPNLPAAAADKLWCRLEQLHREGQELQFRKFYPCEDEGEDDPEANEDAREVRAEFNAVVAQAKSLMGEQS